MVNRIVWQKFPRSLQEDNLVLSAFILTYADWNWLNSLFVLCSETSPGFYKCRCAIKNLLQWCAFAEQKLTSSPAGNNWPCHVLFLLIGESDKEIICSELITGIWYLNGDKIERLIARRLITDVKLWTGDVTYRSRSVARQLCFNERFNDSNSAVQLRTLPTRAHAA
jgi:hypothetical protein